MTVNHAHILTFNHLCKQPESSLYIKTHTHARTGGHTEGKSFGVSSNRVDNIGG